MTTKQIMFLLLALVSASVIFAQTNKQKVAVYVTGDADNGTKKVIGSKLVSAITNDDGYAAVERTTDFLAELSKEQSYQASGAVADNQIVALGKHFGVRFVCVADVSSVYGSTFVAARMINVETAIVTATAERDMEVNGMADLTELSEDVADGLLNNVAPCNKKGKSATRNGCCEGLVVLDGICVELNEYVKKECGFEIMIKSGNEACPNGWRTPTEVDLRVLHKHKTVLENLIPFGKYTIGTFDTPVYTALPYRNRKGSAWFINLGISGFKVFDMANGNVNTVTTRYANSPAYAEDYYPIDIPYDWDKYPYPPFWVR